MVSTGEGLGKRGRREGPPLAGADEDFAARAGEASPAQNSLTNWHLSAPPCGPELDCCHR